MARKSDVYNVVRFFLTACEKETRLKKKDRDITSEIAVTPFTNKKDNIDWNSSVVKKMGNYTLTYRLKVL